MQSRHIAAEASQVCVTYDEARSLLAASSTDPTASAADSAADPVHPTARSAHPTSRAVDVGMRVVGEVDPPRFPQADR